MIINGINRKNGKHFQIETKEQGRTLLSILQEHGIFLDAPCNGKGTCGRCRVSIENEMQLACQTVVSKDCKIELPESGQEEIEVLTEKNCQQAKVYQLPENNESGKQYGIAIDIGTTTLAMELVDLESGKVCNTAVSVNHQRTFGADVISRIQAANEGKGSLLQNSIRTDLNRMIDELLAGAMAFGTGENDTVEKIVIAGNTTMCHLLCGYSCKGLGVAPFTPEDISLQKKTASEILDRADITAEVTILPGISAFVGADIVAGIYACDMDLAKHTEMLLDIGTNGEMVIGGEKGFLVTSTAAGPVFEGGNISNGMPGVPGAIKRIRLTEDAGAFENTTLEAFDGNAQPERKKNPEAAAVYETIGGQTAAGFCGSGIIDMAAELILHGYMDENGTLSEPWFESGIYLAGTGLSFSQQDIREIQMGKAAIRSGIETLLLQWKGSPFEEILFAGGFGCGMDPARAEQIGLFPQGFHQKGRLVGNSALEGARRFLTDRDGEKRVNWIVSHTRELNLANQEQFDEMYIQYMLFEK